MFVNCSFNKEVFFNRQLYVGVYDFNLHIKVLIIKAPGLLTVHSSKTEGFMWHIDAYIFVMEEE